MPRMAPSFYVSRIVPEVREGKKKKLQNQLARGLKTAFWGIASFITLRLQFVISPLIILNITKNLIQ